MARPRRNDQLSDATARLREDRPVDLAAVRRGRAALPGSDLLRELTGLFAALGDPTRLRIIAVLTEQELCVGDLSVTIGQTPSAVSHQLRHLRSLGLVRGRRAGRRVYYGVDDQHVSRLYGEALDHVRHRTEGSE
jgi:ArsR family transcriptional regulator